MAALATPAWRNDEVGFRNRTGSCNILSTRAAPRDQIRGRAGEPARSKLEAHGSVSGSDGRGRADLGNWVAEFLGVGDVVAPDADDLRAR